MQFRLPILRGHVPAEALETEFPKALRGSVVAELEFAGRTHQRTHVPVSARRLTVWLDPGTAHEAPRRVRFPRIGALPCVNRPVERVVAATRLHVRVRSGPPGRAARAGR